MYNVKPIWKWWSIRSGFFKKAWSYYTILNRQLFITKRVGHANRGVCFSGLNLDLLLSLMGHIPHQSLVHISIFISRWWLYDGPCSNLLRDFSPWTWVRCHIVETPPSLGDLPIHFIYSPFSAQMYQYVYLNLWPLRFGGCWSMVCIRIIIFFSIWFTYLSY